MKFATKAIHIGEEPNFKEGGTGDVVIPIHLSTTFARKELEHPTAGYEYSRTGNPTRTALETRLSALENAKFGLAFASGMAAETTLVLSLLKSGDHIVAFEDLYGGTRRLFSSLLEKFQIQTTYVDARDPQKVEDALAEQTKIIWLETPTNPLLQLCDIQAISSIAGDHDVLTIVDNTFMSPYCQNPLDLGADIVVHSTTKYIGGHSDVVGGAIMGLDPRLSETLKFYQNAIGAIPSPFDSYLLLRGIKTLHLRMERHSENAKRVALYLQDHSKVKRVTYPGLSNFPQYELARKQMVHAGGMVSVELKGGLAEAKAFLSALKVFRLAESLGGVESLIEHPASMTHASVPQEERKKLGINDSFIRISVGIEDSEDLISDLEEALKHV